jgi:hypothetical protein
MATVVRKKKYRCTDDCRQSGCPGHEAELVFQSTSMIYSYDKGQGGQTYFFDDASLQTLIDLLWKLKKSRADMVDLIPKDGK